VQAKRPRDLFRFEEFPLPQAWLGAMKFLSTNYDQDRVSSCCHHILDTHGNLVSFCEYNARLRHGDSWNGFPRIGAPA
jgi:uncharacterized radical SAM superfamily Fe-S cluster-containing enzyme